MPCYQIPIVKLQSLMPLVPCLCRLTVHDARLPKAGATFRSLPVFSCFLGLIVLLCRQAKDCGIKTPGGPPALTAKWSWQFGSDFGGFGDVVSHFGWSFSSETVHVAHLGGWLQGTHITVFSTFYSSSPQCSLNYTCTSHLVLAWPSGDPLHRA